MRNNIYLLIIVLTFSGTAIHGQIHQQAIKYKIIHSDSVIVVRHDSYDIHGEPGKSGIRRELLIGGFPNNEIITHQFRLESKSTNSLTELFTNMKYDSLFAPAECWNPHHSIFIYENGKCSYLDICFLCNNYQHSNDLLYDKHLLQSYEAYKELEKFFISLGIKIDD